MKIFVCIKQVPDTETKIKFNADKTGIDPAGIKWVVNPYDEFAIEEAIKIRDANPGATVWAITVGPKSRVNEALRTALAMGADEGISVVSDEGLDNLTTAKALAKAIQAEGGAQLILTGKLAIDDNSSAVSQMVAEILAVPHTTVVSKLTFDTEKSVSERDVEGGAKEVVQTMNPSVIAANKGLNLPRYASLPGIMKAKKKVIKEIELSSLGLSSADNKVSYTDLTYPADKPAAKLISGDAASQSQQLIQLLRDEAKVL